MVQFHKPQTVLTVHFCTCIPITTEKIPYEWETYCTNRVRAGFQLKHSRTFQGVFKDQNGNFQVV
jgi:hypothetical protein